MAEASPLPLTESELERYARHIVLPVLGAEKRDIFDQAAQPGPESQFPVRHALFSPDAECDVFLSA